MGCLFVNLRLTHKPCLGITMVTVVCVVLDHQGVNFLTIVRVNKEVVTLPKYIAIVIPVSTIVSSPGVTRAIMSF